METAPGNGTKLSVVVCTYNRCGSLRATLNSLAELAAPGGATWELLVVDNNSTDGTRDTIQAFAAKQSFPVRYVFEQRQGHSCARNAGISHAQGDIIAFTDDDVTVDRMWLARLAEAFEGCGCAGAGGRVLPVWEKAKPKWLSVAGPFRTNAVVSVDFGEEPGRLKRWATGANMAFRREIFERFGGFRTDLGRSGDTLISGDDSEFCSRIMQAGEFLMYAPGAIVYHPVTADRLRKAYFREWYFQGGKTVFRMEGAPQDARRYWGIPRYLFRQCASNAVKWWLSVAADKRFYYQLQTCQIAGMIAEARQTRG
jgi:glycosyltransferase involved in cell wall biosynthesis